MRSAIIGFRIWRYDEEEQKLFPVYIGTSKPWEQTSVADCNSDYGPIHSYPEIPAEDCRCGLHAYYDLKDALREAYELKTNAVARFFSLSTPKEAFCSGQLVVGTVAGLGNTEMHAHGFRSERMDILALAPIDDSAREEVIKISKNLGVKCLSSPKDLKKFSLKASNDDNAFLPGEKDIPEGRRKEELLDIFYRLQVAAVIAILISLIAIPSWMFIASLVEFNTLIPAAINIFLIPLAYLVCFFFVQVESRLKTRKALK